MHHIDSVMGCNYLICSSAEEKTFDCVFKCGQQQQRFMYISWKYVGEDDKGVDNIIWVESVQRHFFLKMNKRTGRDVKIGL